MRKQKQRHYAVEHISSTGDNTPHAELIQSLTEPKRAQTKTSNPAPSKHKGGEIKEIKDSPGRSPPVGGST